MKNNQNQITREEYIKLNQTYLAKKKELDDKIMAFLSKNKNINPAGLEEYYFLDYTDDITEEQENEIHKIDLLFEYEFQEERIELKELLDKIINYSKNIVNGEAIKEN